MSNSLKRTINPDLAKERQACTFSTEELTNFIDGSKEKTQTRREIETYFLKCITPPKIPLEYLSHQERYNELLRMSVELYKHAKKYTEEHGNYYEIYCLVLGANLGTALTPEGNPIALHVVMFMSAILGQGTEEQIEAWITRAMNLEFIGTYAQTELGHGTFIRGLETTAHYDLATEEFVLNSPTLTSYKWWPGGLGHASNYAIVMAQLYTQGKCHGIHPFIVQLRDEETHSPLPGIKIGEIGVKLSLNASNNGYLGFTHVRIPRKHMLMKNSKVLKDGTYFASTSSKLTYGTLVMMRVGLVQNASEFLKKAVTISVRYSAVRRQSKLKESEEEPQILDFVTQQFKLLPLISTVFAFGNAGTWLWALYTTITNEMEGGQLHRLPELHAMSCGLKAISTSDCSMGVETCRLACGGHGFMISSNLPSIYGGLTAACTYEGENTVLLLQTARYLIKTYQGFLNGEKLGSTLEYLVKYKNFKSPSFESTVGWIISGFEQVAARQIETTYRKIQSFIQNGVEYEYAWNQASIELLSAAEMHCRVNILSIYNEAITLAKADLSPELFVVMGQLLELYCVSTALRFSGKLLQYTDMSGQDVHSLQTWLEGILALLRPNAVGIVDGFDLCDEILRSTLGAYDGNVYERLFAEAQKSPMNQDESNEGFHKYLKPFLKSNM